MKPLLSFLLLMFVLGYAHTQQGSCEKGQSALYLDDNGVTIKARKCTRSLIGEFHTLYGVEYEIVNNETLKRRYKSGVNLSRVVTTFVTNMSEMFLVATNFNQDLSQWDTSQVTTMGGMFWGARSFNQDLSQWDTSQVTNMFAMFQGARSFNQDLSQWDTSQVTDMSLMFWSARSFNQDLSQWDTSNVEDMSSMFWGARSFNQDLSRWNVRNVTDCKDFDKNSKLSRGYRPNFVKCGPGND